MRANYGMRNRQRGVAAVIMGIAAIALFGFMGIAVDLAYTYSRKTELQNAADAASLSGAKELNEKAAGVTAAIAKAIATFNQNNTNNLVGSTFVITSANMRLGSCPNPDDRLPLRSPSCTFVAATSVTTDAAAAGKTFLEVSTPTHTKNTFFMAVTGGANLTTDTYGYAVAGRFVTDVTPIGICAIDPIAPATKKYTYPDGTTTELVEWGYRRGVAYDLFQLNPLGPSPSQPWLVNPVDTFPGSCNNSHGSANFTAPFVCQGNSGIANNATSGLTAYGNSGLSDSVVKALNSRFDVYSGAYGSNQCDPATAPPDTNIKQYCYSGSGCQTPPTTTPPNDWMESTLAVVPSQQTVSMRPPPISVPQKRIPQYLLPSESATPNLAFNHYGALWSYGPAYHADASTPPKAGTEFTPAQANAQLFMYNTGVAWPGGSFIDTTDCTNHYPCTPGTGFLPSTPAAPYNQTSGKYFQAPAVHPGTRNRRILNLLIVDCANVTGSGGVCNVHIPVLGIGKYFMQKMADPTGSKKIEVEFAGLIQPVPTSEIKLYR
jgi:Flp pilus assembly protein TadG